MAFFTKSFSDALAPKESTAGAYLNPSSIPDGESVRFAILSESPLEGVEIWFNKAEGGMTKRITPEWPDDELLAELERQVGGTVTVREGRKAIKRCTAFFIYDYADECVKVFSANQKSLISDINRLTSDEDYANLNDYDLKIMRTGKKENTKYITSFINTKRSNPAIAKAVINAWDAACTAGANLEVLYDG